MKLIEIHKTKLEEHLPYLNEWYNIGEQYAVAELFRSFGIVHYDNQRKDYQLYTIYEDSNYIGVIGYECYECDVDNAWLAWTFVIPEHRGKGYGKLVFVELMNILSNKSYSNLYIDSVEDQNTQEFYKKLGFEYISDCKTFRKNNPEYSKEILIYNDNPVYVKKLNK